MLNMTKVELELMSDEGMWLFFRKGTGGGVSYIPKRYSKTNNKYLNSYDPKQESKYFTYWNTNNLYGYPVSKFLPTGRTKWSDQNKYSSK